MAINKLSTLLHKVTKDSILEFTYKDGKIISVTYNGALTKLTLLSIYLDTDIINLRVINDIEGNITYVSDDLITKFMFDYKDTLNVIKDINNLLEFNEFSATPCDYTIISRDCSYNKVKTGNNDAFVIIHSAICNDRVCIFFLDNRQVLLINKTKACITNFNNIFNIN